MEDSIDIWLSHRNEETLNVKGTVQTQRYTILTIVRLFTRTLASHWATATHFHVQYLTLIQLYKTPRIYDHYLKTKRPR